MTSAQIIGIMLIKNEDKHVEWAIRNCIAFCDLLIVADDGSEDQTLPIVQRLAEEFPTIQIHRIGHANESQALIEPYAGTKTWVFGVDGDEIYDPKGLAALRKDLLAGRYDDYWEVVGNVLQCKKLDPGKGIAEGYLAPPACSMTKLFNFARISSWTECPQRLHRGKLVFKDEPNENIRVCDLVSWDEADFRCLHAVFMQRSSTQTSYSSWYRTRWNPSEIRRNARLDWSLGFQHVLKQIFMYPLGRMLGFDMKYRRYRVGPLVRRDVASFFPATQKEGS